MQYEVRCGPDYTNITKSEMFKTISETVSYMEHISTFDRLVVVVLTHGAKVIVS